MKIEKRVLNMTLAAIFTAIIIMMAAVPFLGYIPLGFMNATIIHVPVIIGAILLGPRYGAYFGLVFGITSLVRATLTPNATSFVFSPFVTIGEYGGNLWSVVICLVPRILIGVSAYYVYRAAMAVLKNRKGGQTASLWLAGIFGSMTNTILVMNGIYLFFGNSYAAASNWTVSGIYNVILGMIAGVGIPEAVVAGILTAAVGKVLFRVRDGGK